MTDETTFSWQSALQNKQMQRKKRGRDPRLNEWTRKGAVRDSLYSNGSARFFSVTKKFSDETHSFNFDTALLHVRLHKILVN